uniref:hypothetical protein n=1 Tax=Prevotella sp. TaxID=59823 RepID=UPI00402A43FD
MRETDKRDCLIGVQEYIKQNAKSKDKEALIQAIEKVLQQNYIFGSDVFDVLDYINANKGGILHRGYRDSKGMWHDDSYELELDIWTKGYGCYDMVSDAIYKLKKKYTYMQSRNVGGSSSACGASPECVCPADSDVTSVGGVSPEDGKEDGKQPQQLGDLENKRKFAEHILIQDKLGLLEELHNLLDNKIGKYVAMTIRAAVEVGVMSRPYFPEVKAEFVEVGNKSGYNAYYNKVEAYDKNDFEYVKEKLLKYKKVEN